MCTPERFDWVLPSKEAVQARGRTLGVWHYIGDLAEVPHAAEQAAGTVGQRLGGHTGRHHNQRQSGTLNRGNRAHLRGVRAEKLLFPNSRCVCGGGDAAGGL